MEHLKQETVSGAQLNMAALYQICPQCFTESKDPKTSEVRRSVDFEKLRLLLGDNVAEGDERYDFTWVGKRAALQEAAKPIRKTLRPCPEESVDWENTKNLYIEGDNLEVLKLLQNSYMGKVKMIYIDPPYNTGSDFVYHDNFHRTQREEDEAAGVINEEGQRMVKNTESNGKFHSDWCSMIYSRLMVARSLLTEDGIIFISIDDHELDNLKKICDEVLGGSNYVSTLIIESSVIAGPRRVPAMQGSIVKTAEYCLIYTKNGNNKIIKNFKYDFIEGFDSHYCNWIDESNKQIIPLTELISKTPHILDRFRTFGFQPNYKNLSKLISVDETLRNWLYSESIASKLYRKGDKENIDSDAYPLYQLFKEGGKWYIKTEDGTFNVFRYIDRIGICDDYFTKFGERQVRGNLWKGFSSDGGNLDKEGGVSYKGGKKPLRLIKQLLHAASEKNEEVILDFFAGSATTAHAVMQLNAENNSNRKFIMIQWPENLDESLLKATGETKTDIKNQIKFLDEIGKPHSLSEIGKERIRRAGKNLLEEQKTKQDDLFSGEQKKLDVGFRVFKCADSNMKDVYYAPAEYSQELLLGLEDNIKEDRNDLDLLFGCMLDWGVTLDLPLRTEKVDGINIHIVNEGDLVACFEKHIPESVIDHIASLLPMRVELRDSCFDEAKEKMNFFEIFKQRTGWSEEEIRKNVKVI